MTTTNNLPSTRPAPARARSSSLSVVLDALLHRDQVAPEPVAAPTYRRSFAAPRKSSLKSLPTGFEPHLPVTTWLDVPPVFDDQVSASPVLQSSSGAHELNLSLSSTLPEDSDAATGPEPQDDPTTISTRITSFKSSIIVMLVRTKLRIRRRSRPALTRDHAHPYPNCPRRLVPDFSQPGYSLLPAIACVEEEYDSDNDQRGIVRFILPDENPVLQSPDHLEEPNTSASLA
ncbi:hypothetical protein MIND_00380800 [Mycena indigotica]|uniref:Uncharacterized protein n=1 Tax=Mycena indigotica TaxID=2126181 RepID=A0A8H6T4H1_9AGAR|nr:uncharacterized protein MIND_00380800 [Mycena indigotica]KAF7310076.1 hypothetical protein MIND_00380800 [Mycena indigotica]